MSRISNMTVRPVFNPAFRGVMGDVFPFSMDRLFAAGGPGVWYDPSDLTTLFQNAFGATPVTAPGQTVGLMLDKSQGAGFDGVNFTGLGSELVTNGTFDAGLTGWTAISYTGSAYTSTPGVASVASGQVTLSAASGFLAPYIEQSFNTEIGKTYIISAEVVSTNVATRLTAASTSGIGLSSRSANAIAQAISASGTGERSISFVATGTTSWVRLLTDDAATSATVVWDNISVRALPGNHATQSTALSRPTYGIVPSTGRRNLMLASDAFPPTGGVASGAVNNGDGSVTFSASGQGAFKTIAPTSTSSGQVITLSVTLSGTGTINLAVLSGAGGTLNPIPVTLTSTPTRYTNTVTNTSTGLNCGLSITSTSAGTCAIAKIQLELGSVATAYQRVTTRFDVTETGVPSLGYLFFDGSGDFMVTPAITPGTDKVQVFAGVQKLSDAARGTVVEFSADASSNNGAVHLTAPNAASETYAFESKGTALTDAVATSFAAPSTNVVTGLGDIAGDSTIIRVDGIQADADAGDQGTGNYLAYPMYIGRRGGVSLPFNGNIYSLVIRFGPNLNAQRIRQVERYVNEKTRVIL